MNEIAEAEINIEKIIEDSDMELLPVTETGEVLLSDREKAEFKEDCKTIINELGSFVRVGKALKRIQRKKLYRGQFKTFKACVKELFDLGRSRAYRIMDAAGVMEQLEANMGENVQNFGHFLPKNEDQAATLLTIPEEKRSDIWLKTIKQAEGKVTAKKVRQTILEEGVTELKKKSDKETEKRKRSAKAPYQPFEDALRVFMDQISEAYLSDWQKVSKKDVVKHLEIIRDYIDLH